MSHIIIILDGEPVVVDHDDNGGNRSAPAHVLKPLTDWDAFDHSPAMIQIMESNPQKMAGLLKKLEKFCKDKEA